MMTMKDLFQVLVFIHGGAFILGSYTAYGPHHLLVQMSE